MKIPYQCKSSRLRLKFTSRQLNLTIQKRFKKNIFARTTSRGPNTFLTLCVWYIGRQSKLFPVVCGFPEGSYATKTLKSETMPSWNMHFTNRAQDVGGALSGWGPLGQSRGVGRDRGNTWRRSGRAGQEPDKAARKDSVAGAGLSRGVTVSRFISHYRQVMIEVCIRQANKKLCFIHSF